MLIPPASEPSTSSKNEWLHCPPRSSPIASLRSPIPYATGQPAAGYLATLGSAYGSQANVELAAQNGVALEAPVPDPKPTKREPTTTAPQSAHEARRAKQESDEWKQEYAARSGIEGLNATLKNQHGLRRLRVRGDDAVQTSIYLKVTGWNVQTAAKIILNPAIETRPSLQAVADAANPSAPQFTVSVTNANLISSSNQSNTPGFWGFNCRI